MQIKAIIVSLFMAATVTAAPTILKGDEGRHLPANTGSLNTIGNGIGNNIESEPAVASHNGNGNGNGNGSGNAIASGNDLLNVNYGASSRQISQEVVAAMKSLTLTCRSPNSEGVMSCTWKS